MMSRGPVAWAAKKRQIEIIVTSYLPMRTVQVVIENLNSQGLMTERNSLDDVRKKVYQQTQPDWL
jgi:hypothetical protein